MTEIADALGIEKWAAEKRLRKAGVKILTREAIYPPDAIERIKDTPPPGRPKIERAEAARIEFINAVKSGNKREIKKKERLYETAVTDVVTDKETDENAAHKIVNDLHATKWNASIPKEIMFLDLRKDSKSSEWKTIRTEDFLEMEPPPTTLPPHDPNQSEPKLKE